MSLIVDMQGRIVTERTNAGSTKTRNMQGGQELVAKLADHVEAVGLVPSGVPDEYRYASLPICVIDAVYSIGVTYTSTKATVARFCERHDWPRLAATRDDRGAGSHGLNELLHLYVGLEPEEAADRLFGNRQRTSTRSGILKAEAVRLFSDALVRCGIDHFDDITDERIEQAEATVLALPGQGSGIAFDYFRMLAGNDDLIKPDRMVLRFVANALGLAAEPTPRQAALLVRLAARKLSGKNPEWTPLKLDYAIWHYQSSKPIA
nr:hypothetical protein [Nitrosomonas nitrosa]